MVVLTIFVLSLANQPSALTTIEKTNQSNAFIGNEVVDDETEKPPDQLERIEIQNGNKAHIQLPSKVDHLFLYKST